MHNLAPTPRVVGRLAGVLLAACGTLSAATLPLPQPAGTDKQLVLVVSLVAIAIGGIAVAAPWHRWHPRASLVLLPLAFALISAGNYLGNAQPYTYSVFFIVAFVWLGLGHPRWTSVPFLLPAAVAYALPFLLRPESTNAGAASALLVIPVCAFVAEAVAWIGARERRARERSSALARVALALGPHLNVVSLSQTLVEEMRTMLGAERSAFLLVRHGVIEHVFSAGFPGVEREELHALTGQRLRNEPGLADLAAGHPVIAEDTRKDSPLIDDPTRYDVRSYLAVPVLVEDELRGILIGTDHVHARGYNGDDVHNAQALAAQASSALRNALLYEQTLEAAHRDYLTDLRNRRAFHEQLEAEVRRARTEGCAVSVVVLDVDHLKEVNDALGHTAGDEVLIRIGTSVRNTCRRQDDIYRIGGDEFAVVLPETGPAEAGRIAERIRLAIERADLVSGGLGRSRTISLGVGSFPAHGRDADEVFERADTALYDAKRAGRNAVCVAQARPASRHEPAARAAAAALQ